MRLPMTMVVLHNDFHHTSVRIRLRNDGWLSRRQIRRIRRALCGMSDCTCGDDLGMRGRNDYYVYDYDTRPHCLYPICIDRIPTR